MAAAGLLGTVGLVGAAAVGPGAIWASAITASAALLAICWKTGGLVLTAFGMYLYFAAAEAANRTTDPTLTAVAYSAVAAAYLIRLARTRPRFAHSVRVIFLVAFFAAWMIASVVFLSEPGGVSSRKMSLAPFFMAGPFVAGLLLRREDIAELLHLIVLLAAMLAAAAAAHLVVNGTTGQDRISIWAGWNPISHAMTLVAGVLALMPALAHARGYRRFAVLAASAGLALIAVLAGSRGPLIGLAVALSVHFVLARRFRRSTRVIVSVAAVTLFIGAKALLPEEIADRFRPSSVQRVDYAVNSVALRETQYADALRIFTNHPVMGVGVGNFAVYSSDGFAYPHNLLLEVAAEMGIAGLVFFLPLVFFVLRRAVELIRTRATEPREAWLDQALGLLIVLVAVESNISGDLQGSAAWWLMIGMAAASLRAPTPDQSASPAVTTAR